MNGARAAGTSITHHFRAVKSQVIAQRFKQSDSWLDRDLAN